MGSSPSRLYSLGMGIISALTAVAVAPGGGGGPLSLRSVIAETAGLWEALPKTVPCPVLSGPEEQAGAEHEAAAGRLETGLLSAGEMEGPQLLRAVWGEGWLSPAGA